MLNHKIIQNFTPIFSIVLLAIFSFLGNDFLTPGTYSVYGDTAFPLVDNYINTYLFTWDPRGGFGLGQSSMFPPYLPTYFLVYLWSLLGWPLWIANRLWFILPDILLGFGAFYLYRSLFNNRYSWICGTISAVFIMLLPEKFPLAVLELGFAGSLFAIGGITRGLFANEADISKTYIIVVAFSLGTVLASQGFRYFQISIIIIASIILLSICYYRKDKQRLLENFKFLSLCTVLALLLNLFWIVPLCSLLAEPGKSITASPEATKVRMTFSKEHQKMTNPLYVLRASTGGHGLGRPPYYYFSYPLILPFSFLLPLYCFMPLLLRDIDIKIRLLIYGAVALTLFLVSFHFSQTVNMFLRNYIPLFWALGNPQYWACYVGVAYGLIIGSTTEHFLFLIDREENKLINKISLLKKRPKIIFVGCICFVVIVFGGGFLLDKPLTRGFHSKSFLYGNKLPYIKIPEEYDRAEQYIAQNAAAGERLWYIDTGNYKRYTWSYEGHMPEIMFFKSPIPAVGRPLSYATPIIYVLSDIANPRKTAPEECPDLVSHLGSTFNLRYLFIHKDYFFEADKDLTDYMNTTISKSSTLKKVMDNDLFTLYENTYPPSGLIYIAGQGSADSRQAVLEQSVETR